MTPDKAIKAIKEHCYFANLVPIAKEALDMAIEAIEQEKYYKDLAQSYQKTIVKLTEAIAEKQPSQDWIPLVRREPTEEEKKVYFEQNGEELGYMLDNKMPDNGQKVLVSADGIVTEDVFDEDFYNFENWDIEDVEAWMPLPKPYEVKNDDEERSS